MTDAPPTAATLVLILDLMGTFVFAISGASLAVRHRLDIFGMSVLALAAGTAGGVARDLLIGAVPVAAVSDWRYIAISILATIATYIWYTGISERRRIILTFDAVGLGIFAVSGAQKALDFGINPFVAALLGMLTGIGGGMLRDLLVREIPIVMRAELYALAAFAGAAVVVLGHLAGAPDVPVAVGGAILCIAMRLLALRRRWNLPLAPAAE